MRMPTTTIQIDGMPFITPTVDLPGYIKKTIPSTIEGGLTYGDHTEEALQAEILKRLHLGVSFVDVGAYVGFYSLIAMRRGASVTAFEPNPESAEILIENACANSHLGVIAIQQCALGAQAGQAYLSRMSHVSPEVSDTVIRVSALDDFHNLRFANIVKIDVEGMAWNVYEGGRKTFVEAQTVFVECHDNKVHNRPERELFQEFELIGYACSWISDVHFMAERRQT